MNIQGVTRRLFSSVRPSIEKEIFYLDLPGNHEAKTIEKRILDNGGRVDHFFSKDVTCVVTKSVLRRSPRAKNGSQQKNQPLTRAQNILASVKQKGKDTKDGKKSVLAVAESLGIAVITLEQMQGLIGKTVPKTQATKVIKEREDLTGRQKSASVRTLRAPFIKVEDQSRLYQPLLKEMQEFPKIYLDSVQPDCPFDAPARTSQRGARSSRKQRSSQSARSTQKQKVKFETAKATGHLSSSKKVGYCELCNVNYRGFKQHLKGKRHLENASNSNAFQKLDSVIKEGRSVGEYLESFSNQKTPQKSKNQSPKLASPLVTPVKFTAGGGGTSPSKNVTPLKIVFSPKNGYSVMKVDSPRKRKPEVIDLTGEDVLVDTTVKKRKIDNYSVVQLSNLKLKIRRSTRLLRSTSSDQHGSVFLDFPTYKSALQEDESTSENERALCPKFGSVQGKLRLSTRILDSEDHHGLEEYKCPIYLDTSDV